MNLVFLGTSAFAVSTLERIAQTGHRVLCVVTQPDRAKGRGHATASSPIKELAVQQGLSVYQPLRIRRPEAVTYLAALKAEVMVIVAYGQIIPQSIIDLPRHGIINVHASLLPKYRGAAPIQWAIMQGEHKTGVTTMRIDAGLDTGDILLSAETDIGPDETAPELSERLARMGADLLIRTLDGLAAGTLAPRKQEDALATYAPILKKEDGWIDWTMPAQTIHNRVRGLNPWPGAFTRFRDHTLHIWRSRVARLCHARQPGRLIHSHGLFVMCGDGAMLELIEVQLQGRNRMPAEAFANGQRLREDEKLGEQLS